MQWHHLYATRVPHLSVALGGFTSNSVCADSVCSPCCAKSWSGAAQQVLCLLPEMSLPSTCIVTIQVSEESRRAGPSWTAMRWPSAVLERNGDVTHHVGNASLSTHASYSVVSFTTSSTHLQYRQLFGGMAGPGRQAAGVFSDAAECNKLDFH